MQKKMVQGYIFAILSAVIYGCMPLMAKHIYADGVNPLTLVFLRNILALPCLAVLAFCQHKTLKVPVKEIPKISLLSVMGCCVTPILLFSSYNYISTGAATVFHFVYPSIVVLIGFVFFKRKLLPATLSSVILCFLGVCLFYNPAEPLHWGGAALSLASGVTFAIYVVMLSNFKNEKVSGFLFTFYVAAVSSVTTFIMCMATNSLALPQSATGWILCITFALSVTVGAVVLFQQGAFIIGGEKTAILGALEPITGVVVGVLAFGESVAPRILIGSVLVISASIIIAIADMKKKTV